ncbi:MAG: hypothetical protein ACE5EF_03485 [Dehalococcoidia bacterium]
MYESEYQAQATIDELRRFADRHATEMDARRSRTRLTGETARPTGGLWNRVKQHTPVLRIRFGTR